MIQKDELYLITGGTGVVGQALCSRILYMGGKVRVFSRSIDKLNNDKRNIFVLKPIYLNILFDDLEEIMANKKGSTQFISETLVRGDNIRLYD